MMTDKWKDVFMKQILTIVTTLATMVIILAFKAPFLFRDKVETELGKKADIEIIATQLEKKLDKATFVSHVEQQKTEYESIQKLLEAQDKKLDLAVDLLKDRR